jgi:uncharacterized protein with GYD domain
MATYISLLTFTPQGLQRIKDTTKRAEAFKDKAKQKGASLKDVYWTLGEYDVVTIIDAPNDETVTALLYDLVSVGNVHTKTLKAFSAQEMGKIVAGMA